MSFESKTFPSKKHALILQKSTSLATLKASVFT